MTSKEKKKGFRFVGGGEGPIADDEASEKMQEGFKMNNTIKADVKIHVQQVQVKNSQTGRRNLTLVKPRRP